MTSSVHQPRKARRTVDAVLANAVLANVGACVAVVAAAGVLASCSARSTAGRDRLLVQPVPRMITVHSRRVPGLGTVLVDARGHALYIFPPDARAGVSCTGPCAGTWPALATRSTHPSAGAGVTTALLATVADPNSGARAVTYAGYPLYRYAGDTAPGTANGQGLFLDGGPWYALTPAGNPVTTTPDPALDPVR